MEEAAEAGPMRMDGGKTREMELFFSRLPISGNCASRAMLTVERELPIEHDDAAACVEKATGHANSRTSFLLLAVR